MHTLLRNLSLVLQIALIAYHNDWEIILILNPQNLLLERQDFLETLSARDAVHQQEALARSHILLSHRRIFFLARGIKDIEQCNLFVDHALLAVGICMD
jgi:hypothetical protein